METPGSAEFQQLQTCQVGVVTYVNKGAPGLAGYIRYAQSVS